MKKLALPIALLVVCGLAYGKGKPLADKQLDKISAGSAIADGESTATDSRDFSLDLDDNALKDASAVNIVNAVNSTVGNGTNVWNGDHTTAITSVVVQENVITQKGIPCDCSDDGAIAAVTTQGGPIPETEVDAATGTAIALDGSSAHSSTELELELSGNAEMDAHAVNIVNAVGSLVGNGTNIASSMNLTAGTTTLTQVNAITQSGH